MTNTTFKTNARAAHCRSWLMTTIAVLVGFYRVSLRVVYLPIELLAENENKLKLSIIRRAVNE